jgi:hypothetical protein
MIDESKPITQAWIVSEIQKWKPRNAIYEIVKAVELGDITRYQANEYIMDVLMNIPPMQETEENS